MRTKSIVNTIEPIGETGPGGRPLGPQDMRPGEVWMLADRLEVILDPDRNPFYPRRVLVKAGDHWPKWGIPGKIGLSRVKGDHNIKLEATGDPIKVKYVYGLEIPGQDIIGSVDMELVFGLYAWGVHVVGNGAIWVPKQGYGFILTQCQGLLENCGAARCSSGIMGKGSNLGIVSPSFPDWQDPTMANERNGYDLDLGHGCGGIYSVSDCNYARTVNGATGYPPTPIMLMSDGTIQLVVPDSVQYVPGG